MYGDFFGFRELPFNNTPDPRFFFPTAEHEEALASLIYATSQRKGFVLLTGEIGAGKTLITRMLIRHFGAAVAFAHITHSVQNSRDLMEAICVEFELPFDRADSHTQHVRVLHDYLLAKFAQNIPVVLVLDEAQNVSVEGFERLRMIGNLESDDAKLLQIAMVGQPELQHLFARPELRQLRQRVFRCYHLPALDRGSTKSYIRHRLAVVTDQPEGIFTDDAMDRIFTASEGLPRVVNTICDNALLSAYSADRKRIDTDFLESVLQQMSPMGEAKRTVAPVEMNRIDPPVLPRSDDSRNALRTLVNRAFGRRPSGSGAIKPPTAACGSNRAAPVENTSLSPLSS